MDTIAQLLVSILRVTQQSTQHPLVVLKPHEAARNHVPRQLESISSGLMSVIYSPPFTFPHRKLHRLNIVLSFKRGNKKGYNLISPRRSNPQEVQNLPDPQEEQEPTIVSCNHTGVHCRGRGGSLECKFDDGFMDYPPVSVQLCQGRRSHPYITQNRIAAVPVLRTRKLPLHAILSLCLVAHNSYIKQLFCRLADGSRSLGVLSTPRRLVASLS
ncbi:hypothetical protein BDM02DRAFT_2983654 [Thelephora ganbajun]|uniref:Uncharacterized protein n=1 Tax=Thelephora ganbajun TaxID=370292 RepID=A0ACB6ZAP9_THEGA|nr:hypothetical protein BDM02DRAFT_2983654 [Thelephora ganbajun]